MQFSMTCKLMETNGSTTDHHTHDLNNELSIASNIEKHTDKLTTVLRHGLCSEDGTSEADK